MKNKLISLSLALTILLSICMTISAKTPRVIDNAGVLSSSEVKDLELKASALTQEYDMEVVILIVEDLDGTSPMVYADDYFDYNGYGIGSNYSGFLLLLATESRDWWISTSGDAIHALTDYGIQELFSAAAPDLRNDNYYDAFDAYLHAVPRFMEAYKDGHPIDVPVPAIKNPVSFLSIVIALAIGAVIGGITIFIMKAGMDTSRNKRDAADYLDHNSFNLYANTDRFLYSNVTRTARPKNTNSGGGGSHGGSSTHVSSSGRSHGGGGGKF